MRTTGRLAAMVVLLSGLVIPASAATACATDHVPLRWAGFPPPIGDFGPVYLYWAEEPVAGDSSAQLTIRANPEGSCPTPNRFATASYAVDSPLGTQRPATPSADYNAIVAGNTGPLWDHRGTPNEHTFPVTIHSDLLIETVAEQARARITATDGKREVPQEVPLWIIDSDGLARTALESAGPYPQEERFREVVIPVFRGGDAAQPLSVDYSVAGSSGAPATPGTDLSVTSPQPLVFAANERVKLITLSLVADGIPEPTEEATVTLGGTGVDPNDPRSATVQIIDSAGGVAAPTSTLHHPRNKFRYPQDDFRIREIHIFTEKGGGGAVTQAELALRMTRKNGSCAWSNGGKRFAPGPCNNPAWYESDGQYEPDFFYSRLPRLRPSTGKIRNYTMYSRAIDLSQGTEGDFDPGRNANTFEVRPVRR